MINFMLDFVLPKCKNEYEKFEDYAEEVAHRFKVDTNIAMSKDFKKTIKYLYSLDDESYTAIRDTRIEYNSFEEIISYVNRGLLTHSPAENVTALIRIRNSYNSIINKFISEISVKYSELSIIEITDHIKNSEGATLYCLESLLCEIDKYNISPITEEYINEMATYENVKRGINKCLNGKVSLKLHAELKLQESATTFASVKRRENYQRSRKHLGLPERYPHNLKR